MKKNTMITLEAIARLRWSDSRGLLLKKMRLVCGLSRAAVSTQMKGKIQHSGNGKFKDGTISTKYIERLEKGEPDSISVEALLALTEILGVEVSDLFPDDESIVILQKTA